MTGEAELAGGDDVTFDASIEVLVPIVEPMSRCSAEFKLEDKDAPSDVKVVRDKQPEVGETNVGELLCYVLDGDVGLGYEPDAGRAGGDGGAYKCGDDGGLPCRSAMCPSRRRMQ